MDLGGLNMLHNRDCDQVTAVLGAVRVADDDGRMATSVLCTGVVVCVCVCVIGTLVPEPPYSTHYIYIYTPKYGHH
jgi:hypothetical protein